MTFDLERLVQFIVQAKKAAYAGDGAEVPSDQVQTPGFKELSFREGDWEYRDSYAGYFFAPGREVVWYQGNPAWMMAYSGGMTSEYRADRVFAKQTFTFLKRVLSQISPERPFRGPASFVDDNFIYSDSLLDPTGDLRDFRGTEFISCKNREVFRQFYFGGVIVPKDLAQSL